MKARKKMESINSEFSCTLETSAKSLIRVLHVDDDPGFLEFSKKILKTEGNFEVDDASSVDEALEKLVQKAYDMFVSDFKMPQKNGLDFLKELRLQKNEVPFVLFTGRGSEEVAITALNMGADGYYKKQGSAETVYRELTQGICSAIERAKGKSTIKKSEKCYNTLLE